MSRAKRTEAPKRKVQTRRENYRNGKWDLKYMQFVYSFILQSGLSMNEAAAKGGITRQTIYHWFDTDDAKISSVEKFIADCGYKVEFCLKKESDMVGDALVTINPRVSATPKSEGRLAFLDDALDRYGIMRKEAAQKLGLSYNALYFWFQHDDVFMSYIYRIAENYGLKLSIRIDPMEK